MSGAVRNPRTSGLHSDWSRIDPALERKARSWCETWGTDGLIGLTHLTLSSRLTTSLGKAFHSRMAIRLNSSLLHPDAAAVLEEVLCHELAHLAAYELHGNDIRPHGKQWKELMAAVGFTPRVTVRVESLPSCLRCSPRKRPRRSRRRRSPSTVSMLRRLLRRLGIRID